MSNPPLLTRFTTKAMGVLAPAAVLATNAWILRSTAPFLRDFPELAEPREVALVPGAWVYRDGRPSTFLADRLRTAWDLFVLGRVERVLVSGPTTFLQDEAGVMERWLLARGLPPDRLTVDPHGYRTLDTMIRAVQVYDVTDAIVCTQAYHLPRSVFLARRAGLDAIGVTADRRRYVKLWKHRLQEMGSRTAAFLDALVLNTPPRTLER